MKTPLFSPDDSNTDALFLPDVPNKPGYKTSKFFVSMVDVFLSYWEGTPTSNKKRVLIFGCANKAEVEAVEQNAIQRNNMRDIQVWETEPNFPKESYFVGTYTKEWYPKWYDQKAEW